MKYFYIFLSSALLACSDKDSLEAPSTNQHQRPEVLVRGAGYLKNIPYYSLDPQLSRNSSVSLKDGKYSIDSAFILANANRKALVQSLGYDNLQESFEVNAIPRFIINFLDSLSDNGKFEIANPEDEWQENWFSEGKSYPAHQLVYFAAGKNVALLSFYSRGIVKSQQVAIIKYQGTRIVDFWFETLQEPITKSKDLISHLRTETSNPNGC